MREMSAWSIAASIFFSVALMSSAQEAYHSAFQLAGAGNPAAVEQSLSGFVSRMGGQMPKPIAEAGGKVVAVSYSTTAAARLQRQKDWTLKDGDPSAFPPSNARLLGLTDGSSEYKVKIEGWNDDNDHSDHALAVGIDARAAMVYNYKPADHHIALTWVTDVNGQLILTAVTIHNSTSIVPNSQYAQQFEGEMKYWDKIVPGGATSIASSATGA